MKRLHMHVGVADLDASIRFYSTFFGAEPTMVKPDYAKWMLDDPRVNFAISTAVGSRGVEHLGIQVEDAAELHEVYGRLKAAEGPLFEEGRTTCCYSRSEKSWTADPDGVVWEAFFTDGEAATYGERPGLAALGERAATEACCGGAQVAPKAACC